MKIMKLTIITINYNNLEGLKRTVESVVNQSWQEFEYIIIDGGSTDGSAAYIENQNDKIDYWVSEPDSGIYNAMNKGILKATGEYLLFLNSGDQLYDLIVLDENYTFIHSKDLVCFDVFLIYLDSTKIHQYPETLNYEFFMKESIGHPTTFINRKLFDKVGLYDENLMIVSDWKFFMTSFVKFNCTYKKINTVLSKYEMNGISSIEIDRVNEERQRVLKEHFPEYLRLFILERLLKDIKKSRTIIFLQNLGLLKFISRIN